MRIATKFLVCLLAMACLLYVSDVRADEKSDCDEARDEAMTLRGKLPEEDMVAYGAILSHQLNYEMQKKELDDIITRLAGCANNPNWTFEDSVAIDLLIVDATAKLASANKEIGNTAEIGGMKGQYDYAKNSKNKASDESWMKGEMAYLNKDYATAQGHYQESYAQAALAKTWYECVSGIGPFANNSYYFSVQNSLFTAADELEEADTILKKYETPMLPPKM